MLDLCWCGVLLSGALLSLQQPCLLTPIRLQFSATSANTDHGQDQPKVATVKAFWRGQQPGEGGQPGPRWQTTETTYPSLTCPKTRTHWWAISNYFLVKLFSLIFWEYSSFPVCFQVCFQFRKRIIFWISCQNIMALQFYSFPYSRASQLYWDLRQNKHRSIKNNKSVYWLSAWRNAVIFSLF